MSFIIIGESESESCSSVFDSFWPHGLHSPWNTPGQNTGVGSLSLFQGIFPTRDRTQVSCIAGRFFTSWATRKAHIIYHYRGLEYKSSKSRNIWSNRESWLWSTEWSRAKASRILPREHAGHSKHPLPTTQEKALHMDIIRWPILKSDWLYSLQPKMEKIYIVSKNKTRRWLWLRSWTPFC